MSDDLSFEQPNQGFQPDHKPTYTPLQPIEPTPEYYRVNSGNGAAFPKAILYGIGGAILGTILYAAFTLITHIEIGYVAIGVGYLVGKAMMLGSANRGGRQYQVAAAILTYLSVSFAAVVEGLWAASKDGTNIANIPAAGWVRLAGIGVASPFLELTDNTFSGLIGLLILFIGIRAAWRLTSSSGNEAAHPFAR